MSNNFEKQYNAEKKRYLLNTIKYEYSHLKYSDLIIERDKLYLEVKDFEDNELYKLNSEYRSNLNDQHFEIIKCIQDEDIWYQFRNELIADFSAMISFKHHYLVQYNSITDDTMYKNDIILAIKENPKTSYCEIVNLFEEVNYIYVLEWLIESEVITYTKTKTYSYWKIDKSKLDN